MGNIYYAVSRVEGRTGRGVCLYVDRGEASQHYVFEFKDIYDYIETCLRTLIKVGNLAEKGSTLIYDFDLVHESFTEGYIKKWEFNGWKTSKGKEVSYRFLWEKANNLIKEKSLKLRLLKKNKRINDPLYQETWKYL